MDKKECDVLIIGGGLVGLSLAKGLEKLGISYFLIDRPQQNSPRELRALALSNSSLAILKYLGIWPQLSKLITPIDCVHVSCEGALGQTILDKQGINPLGGVVNLIELNQILKSSFEHPTALLNGSFQSLDEHKKHVMVEIGHEKKLFNPKIVIAADGANSTVRQHCGLNVEKAIQQTALISLLRFSRPHKGLAFERFTKLGPMALLPWSTHQMVLVWCLHPKEATAFMEKNPHEKQALVLDKIGSRLGDIQEFGEIGSYPLTQVFMPKQVFKHILFLGNAAHTLHPVAGQGFNLSLRDVAVLLDVLKKFGVSEKVFPMYLTQRLKDQRLTQRMTYFLAEQFNQIPLAWRGLGLGVFNGLPFLKNALSHYAQGLGYCLPSWVYQQMESLYD